MSPTLSQIRDWDTAHLDLAAEFWAAEAEHWESSFTRVFQGMARPGGQPWDGDAADQAQLRAYLDRLRVIGVADRLRQVAATARTGARTLAAASRKVLDVVDAATAAGLSVDDNLVITYEAVTLAQAAALEERALAFAARLHAAVAELVALDGRVAAEMEQTAGEIDVADFGEAGRVTVTPDPDLPDLVPTGDGDGEPLLDRLMPDDPDFYLSAAGEVAEVTADGVGAAALKAIEDAPAGASPALVRTLQDVKIGGVPLTGVSRLNMGVGAVMAVPNVIAAIGQGDSAAKAITRETVSTAAGAVGGGIVGGAAAGALAGSVVPGVGTAVGLVVGAVAGALCAEVGSTVTDWAWDSTARAFG